MNEFIEKFIAGYTGLSSKTRNHIRCFNRQISNYKYIMIHPVLIKDDYELMVGFVNDNSNIWPLGEEEQRKAFEFIGHRGHEFLRTDDKLNTEMFNQTLYIETSRFSPIPLETGSWEQLLNAPKIEDGDFDLLTEPFSTFFNLDEHYNNDFDVWEFFQEKNKPSDVELRVVWKDVDSDHKYGNINTLIFWQGEFIGWVNSGSKWLATHVYNTVNAERWAAFMQYLYQCSGQTPNNTLRGIYVVDMNSVTDVESVISIPGLTEPDYGE